MRRQAPILFGALVIAMISFTTVEANGQQLTCEVHALRASASGGEISPELEPYRTHLLRPPLSTFTSFQIIQSQTVTLNTGRSLPLQLQHGIGGEIELTASENGRHQLSLALRHEDRTLVNTRFRASAGHPFFVVVGSVIPSGTLVLGFICR